VHRLRPSTVAAGLLAAAALALVAAAPAAAQGDAPWQRADAIRGGLASALTELEAFAARLRDQEAGGKKFTAEDADTLGRRAQDQAEAIAGQITQAAKQLGIELET